MIINLIILNLMIMIINLIIKKKISQKHNNIHIYTLYYISQICIIILSIKTFLVHCNLHKIHLSSLKIKKSLNQIGKWYNATKNQIHLFIFNELNHRKVFVGVREIFASNSGNHGDRWQEDKDLFRERSCMQHFHDFGSTGLLICGERCEEEG